MNRTFFLLIVIVGALAAIFGYCVVLINWIQNYSRGVYFNNQLENLLVSAALVLYTYFGIRFFYRHVNSLR